MDEPLSNLDAKLRINVRNEIKQIQRKLKITTIYVTHDQEEALSMSDTVVVMNSGSIQQTGTPWEIYNYPNNKFVADFIGMKNFLNVTIQKIDQRKVTVNSNGDELLINSIKNIDFLPQEKILISIRPEDIKIYKRKPKKEIFNIWEGIILQSSYLGKIIRYWIRTENNNEIIAEDYAPKEFLKGKVYLEIDENNIQYIQKE
jgi:ABC-type Fe3+/spermidine/putrescine transport system ATPase subunit